jgi:hypothetical protein
MRSLTQVRRIQLENGWTLTAPNGQAVEYIRRHAHDNRPFTTDIGLADMGERFTAKQVGAVSPAGQPTHLAVTMWRHEPMFHVMVNDSVAVCGRDEFDPEDQGFNVAAHLICPICRPYTGIPRPARPERQWIHDHGSALMHITAGERGTACALYCTPEDYERIGPFARIADSELSDDALRCEVCVSNQDANDLRDGWRYQ